jgi:hypothetical protein
VTSERPIGCDLHCIAVGRTTIADGRTTTESRFGLPFSGRPFGPSSSGSLPR